jgi:hypothetical protein
MRKHKANGVGMFEGDWPVARLVETGVSLSLNAVPAELGAVTPTLYVFATADHRRERDA